MNKTVVAVFVLCAMGLASIAENYVAVWTYGSNALGIATNFPVSWKSLGTNQSYPADPKAIIMTVEAGLALKASTQPSMDAYMAAQAAAVKAATDAETKANVEVLMLSYSNLQWCAENWALATNVTNLRIAVKACGDALLKLKPVLTEWYQRSLGQ
jgi:hypothetical protein